MHDGGMRKGIAIGKTDNLFTRKASVMDFVKPSGLAG
jgi:hypothetical protein